MSMTNRIVRQVARLGPALVLLGILCAISNRWNAAENALALNEAEARILVYVSPIGEAQRAKNLDIAMETQASNRLNQKDYYYFWVYNSKRDQSNGSVTIGYYAVNKHTAEVWDTDEKKQISSKLVLGVQTIIRETHHIDEGLMRLYGGRPF